MPQLRVRMAPLKDPSVAATEDLGVLQLKPRQPDTSVSAES